jgi:uncharacterized protein with ATP-grasp and redox domains
VARFPFLADPDHYVACDTDLIADHEARAYWLDLFGSHFTVQLDAAAANGISAAACSRAREALDRELALLRDQPDRHGRLDILTLDVLRREALAAGEIDDEFRPIKQRENEAAVRAFPERLAVLDTVPEARRFEQLVRGVLAGNLFDMGVPGTADRFGRQTIPFETVLAEVPPRPWLYDDLEAAAGWLEAATPRKAVLFADNAGADAVLGVLPLARHLLQRDMDVVLTANERPSLNDITAAELRAIVEQAAAIDTVFVSDLITIVSSGNAAPLIDLGDISDELADAARDAGLVVLIGMGRAIESNWSARFTCPSLRIAMLKDPQVARTVRGSLYDAVCRWEEATKRREEPGEGLEDPSAPVVSPARLGPPGIARRSCVCTASPRRGKPVRRNGPLAHTQVPSSWRFALRSCLSP